MRMAKKNMISSRFKTKSIFSFNLSIDLKVIFSQNALMGLEPFVKKIQFFEARENNSGIFFDDPVIF